MNSQLVFTVIIPTYNREHCLKRTIDSILSQTFQDFELIIVDDGSTDHTKILIDTYDDDRILYFYKENGGQNSALNMGIQKAKGKYIAFCDSDDTWLPEKLEKHMQKYEEDNEIKVVYSLIGVVKTENGMQTIIPVRDDNCEGWCYKEVMEQGYLTAPSFLSCKKECFDKIGFLPTDIFLCQDDDMCFRLCKHFKVGLIREILGIYHTDASNRIMSQKRRCADDYVKFLNSWGSEITAVCGKGLLIKKYLLAAYYYLEIDEIMMAREIYRHYVCRLENSSLEETKDEIVRNLHADQEILIYGTGDWGKKIYGMLKMLGFSRFLFVCTNDVAQGKDFLYGIPVRKIGTLSSYKDCLLIISSSKYFHEMKTIANEKGFTNIVSYTKIKRMIFERNHIIHDKV